MLGPWKVTNVVGIWLKGSPSIYSQMTTKCKGNKKWKILTKINLNILIIENAQTETFFLGGAAVGRSWMENDFIKPRKPNFTA